MLPHFFCDGNNINLLYLFFVLFHVYLVSNITAKVQRYFILTKENME